MAVKIVMNKFPQIIKGMESNANQAVRITLFDISAKSQMLMTGGKSGAYYARPNGKMHQASAPGEAPAVDTGNLINSIQTRMESFYRGVVYTNAEYGPVLELGGRKMAARPFFVPASKEAWPAFLARMKRITGG